MLVHGAFADSPGWSALIAPANPLRDLSDDAAYVASVVATVPRPVVLVGHSYGGAIILAAAR